MRLLARVVLIGWMVVLAACAVGDGTDTAGSAEAALSDLASGGVVTTTSAGTLDGELSVTPDGQARYVLPLSLPPGRAGMAPDLALTYVSGDSYGPYGLGWSVTGAGGSVHRCAREHARDGYSRSVQIDEHDALCLDGQRLVRMSGEHLQPGSTYRTERESFTVVTQLPGGGFETVDREGHRRRYGTGEASRAIAPAGVFSWHLDQWIDRHGNDVRYSYDRTAPPTSKYPRGAYEGQAIERTFEPVLKRIDYTGTDGESAGTRSVIFVSTRSSTARIGTKYRGVSVELPRVDEIVTIANERLVHRFELKYMESPHDGRERLVRVRQCGQAPAAPGAIRSGGLVCRSPTTFEWQAASQPKSLFAASPWYQFDRMESWPPSDGLWGSGKDHSNSALNISLVMDVNGDGLDDFVYTNEEQIEIAFGRLSGALSGRHVTSVRLDSERGGKHFALDHRFHRTDFNLDGLDDTPCVSVVVA